MSGAKASRRGQPVRAVGLTLASAALVGAVAVAAYSVFGRAEISGEKPPERIAEIHEIAAERPWGTAKVLAEAAENDPSPEVRAEAIAGLSQVLAPEHRAVVEKGTADSDARIRAIAADVLGVFGDKPAAGVLVKLIETDQDEEVVKGALRGLARCDDPRAIVWLLETAEKGSSRDVKLVAMKGLLRKFRCRLSKDRDPSDEANWRDLIQLWKRPKAVRDAYAAVPEVQLVDRPQDIIGKHYHPERREPQGHKD